MYFLIPRAIGSGTTLKGINAGPKDWVNSPENDLWLKGKSDSSDELYVLPSILVLLLAIIPWSHHPYHPYYNISKEPLPETKHMQLHNLRLSSAKTVTYPNLVGFVKATENGIKLKTRPKNGLDLPFLCWNLLINNKGRIHLHSRDVK